MSTQYNTSIRIASPNPSDERYLSLNYNNGRQQPYTGVTHVNETIPYDERYIGLPVNINYVEYWYKNGVNDGDLIEKTYGDTIPTSDLITGATNLGFFSGFTGVQTLEIDTSISGYNGDYQSVYNYFYRDTNGIIRLGIPSDSIPKRGYVRETSPRRSWIWNDRVDGDELMGWILIDGDVREMLGNYFDITTTIYYDGVITFPYTNYDWDNPPYSNGSAVSIFNVNGDLTSGDYITTSAPIYRDIINNELNFRTLKSKTESINIDFDDYYIYLSATTKNIDNIGAGIHVYSGETGNTHLFKSLIPSGNTQIVESQTGNEIIIHTTSTSYTNGYGIDINNNEISVQDDLFVTNNNFNSYINQTQPIIDKSITGATNGLTRTSGRLVKLGGNLINHTTINSSMYNMSIDTNRIYLKSISGISIESDEGSVSLIGNNNTSTSITRIDVSESTLKITDDRDTQKGLEYNDNYHSDFTNRSLVDKEYVDGLIGGGEIFSENIMVSIAAGKTFGRYENGEIIPSSGKTPKEVILMALQEPIEPTVQLNSSSNNVDFGETSKVVNLNFSYVINSLNSSVSETLLEFRRGGSWNLLSSNTGDTTYTHNIDDSGDRFNITTIEYKYTVVDSLGATGITTHTVILQSYTQPTISTSLNGSIISPETQTVREKGNVISNPSGSLTSNRSLVDILEWTLERRYDSDAWVVLDSDTGLTAQSIIISSVLDDTIPTNVDSIEYRVTYVDEYTNGSGGNKSISFMYYSYWGYNSNYPTLDSSEIQALDYNGFKTSNNLVWDNVDSGANYTYYAFPSTYSDITSVLKNGIFEDYGAWDDLLSNVVVTNGYGESQSYRIYRTNATNAYSSDDLVFS